MKFKALSVLVASGLLAACQTTSSRPAQYVSCDFSPEVQVYLTFNDDNVRGQIFSLEHAEKVNGELVVSQVAPYIVPIDSPATSYVEEGASYYRWTSHHLSEDGQPLAVREVVSKIEDGEYFEKYVLTYLDSGEEFDPAELEQANFVGLECAVSSEPAAIRFDL
uniref:hypothetical protein n=1 Tax=Thaumasiovibrio occultus TaxID=1891184 RepID=UPI000B362DE3|nr:hypothetical protein [Thaumasiovibrio occultus]